MNLTIIIDLLMCVIAIRTNNVLPTHKNTPTHKILEHCIEE